MKTAKLVQFTYIQRSEKGRDWEDQRVYNTYAEVDGKFYFYDEELFASNKVIVTTKQLTPRGKRCWTSAEYLLIEYSLDELLERIYNGIDLSVSHEEFCDFRHNRNYRWMANKNNKPIVFTNRKEQTNAMISWL